MILSSEDFSIHLHHPNADSSVTFKGLAAYEIRGDVKAVEYNPPKLEDDSVEIAISHCGICGTDLHIINSNFFPASYPIIVGHEIVGTVTAAGSAVKNVAVGDRVGVGAQCGICQNKKGDCEECGLGYGVRSTVNTTSSTSSVCQFVTSAN